MKIDRHLAIINLIIEYDTVTAPFLAEKLEVSRRTINRDVENLCMAGIPIITKQGVGGGISLMEGYKLDKRLLKAEELSTILTGLKGLSSVDPSISMLLARLEGKHNGRSANETVSVDLASFYAPSLSDKLSKLKEAIYNRKYISFEYYGPKGKVPRIVEPYKILFKWSDWYVQAYCTKREAFRLFKLNRIWALEILTDTYNVREWTCDEAKIGSHLIDNHSFKAKFHRDVEYRLVEAYGPDSYTKVDDYLLFKGSYTSIEYIATWLFGFGNKVEVLSPKSLIQYLDEHKYI